MKIRFVCKGCGKQYSASPDQAGKRGKCKNCGTEITVPMVESTEFQSSVEPGKDSSDGTSVGKKLRGYVAKTVVPGEEVIYQTTLHWIIFGGSFLIFILGLTIMILSNGFVQDMGLWIIVISFILYFKVFVDFKTSEFAVTNRRIIIKIGWLSRDTFELLLTKAESIQVKQGILGRILNYGTITISGTGGSKDPFTSISKPLDFRKNVQEQIQITQAK